LEKANGKINLRINRKIERKIKCLKLEKRDSQNITKRKITPKKK
jgi:hypothetical protein